MPRLEAGAKTSKSKQNTKQLQNMKKVAECKGGDKIWRSCNNAKKMPAIEEQQHNQVDKYEKAPKLEKGGRM